MEKDLFINEEIRNDELLKLMQQMRAEKTPEKMLEVLKLAADSLQACSEKYVLEISHLGLLGAFVDAVASDDKMREELLQCVVEKNLHGIRKVCVENGKSETQRSRFVN